MRGSLGRHKKNQQCSQPFLCGIKKKTSNEASPSVGIKKKTSNEASPFIKEASNEAGLLSLAPLYRHPLPGCLPESRCCFARAGSSVVLHNCCCCWLLLLLLSLLSLLLPLLLSLHRCICAAGVLLWAHSACHHSRTKYIWCCCGVTFFVVC